MPDPYSFLAKYSLGQTLGRGENSVIKVANDTSSGGRFAAKCIIREKISDKEEISILEELELLKSLSHPNIVKIYEVFEEAEFFYQVMETVEGGEIIPVISKMRHYNEKIVRAWILSLASMLSYLHGQGVVYCNLKPEVLHFKNKSDIAGIKILDFSLAVRDNGQCTQTQLMGAPAYVSPEFLNLESYGAPVDMWALGVIMYNLICGSAPFAAETPEELADQIIKGEYALDEKCWSNVSEDAKAFLASCLTVNPKSRLTSTAALEHSWMQLRSVSLDGNCLASNLKIMKKNVEKNVFNSNKTVAFHSLNQKRFSMKTNMTVSTSPHRSLTGSSESENRDSTCGESDTSVELEMVRRVEAI